MIKACLFDLDGTLLDTLTTISHYGNRALSEYGIDPADKEEYKYFAGNGARILVERMLRFREAYSEENFQNVYNFYMESYDSNPTYLTEPYDGIEEMLLSLKDMGIKTGVISNKPDYAAKSVCKNKLNGTLVDFVQGQKEGVPIKPDPAGPMEVLTVLGFLPEETLYVGDSGVDMQTGKNLGSYTVGVSWGFRGVEELTQSGADEIVYSPLDIIEIVKKINKT